MAKYIKIKQILNELLHYLIKEDEQHFVQKIKLSLDNDQNLINYLQSNDLWGGAGSLADQAGIENSNRNQIEILLIELGEEQKRLNIVNPRTEMWVIAFKKWKKNSIEGRVISSQ